MAAMDGKPPQCLDRDDTSSRPRQDIPAIQSADNSAIDCDSHAYLSQGDAPYRILFRETSDAIFLVERATGCFLDANLAAEKITGRSVAQLRQLATRDVAPDGALERLEIVRVATSPVDFGEIVYVRPDGSCRHAQLELVPLDENTAFGIARDITEQKQLDSALRFVAQQGWKGRGDSFLQSLVAFLADTLNVDFAMVARLTDQRTAAETVAVYAHNQPAANLKYDLAGTPCGDVAGQRLCTFSRDIQDQFPKDKLLAEMGANSYVGVPLWNSRGEPLGLIAVLDGRPLADTELAGTILQSVSARAAAELEREQAERALRASEEQFRSLYASMNEGMCLHEVIYDDAGCAVEYRILDVNPAYEKILGVKREDFVGQLSVEAYHSDQPPYLDVYARVAQTGEPAVFETYFPPMDRHFLISVFRPCEGRFATVFTDITDRKRSEAERVELIQKLESQNAELERFTYTVSHDLRAPLITIRSYLGLLKDDLACYREQEVHDDIQRITRAADTMDCLLRDLLELSRIGRIINPAVQVPLEDLIVESLESVAGRIQQQHIQVTIGRSLPTVMADRRRLLEVMQNLVDNAAKYMGDEPSPKIVIGAKQNETETLVWVEDNGIGIEPCYRDRIFGLFDQLNNDAEGTGIGLALVKRIVEVHGGRIWVEAPLGGKGSRFIFALPTKPVVEEAQ